MCRRICVLTILGGVLLLTSATAQPHFQTCASQTGQSASLVIPASSRPTIKEQPLGPESEIAVFTQDGLCIGTGTWNSESLAIALWVDDPQTEAKDGAASGDQLSLRVWDAATRTEYGSGAVQTTLDASQPYFRTEASYALGAVYVVQALSAQAGLAEFASFQATEEDGSARLRWTTAAETDLDGFEVEVREDAAATETGGEPDSLQQPRPWQSVGFVAAAGADEGGSTYQYDVPELAPGSYTFRLKQVGLDGALAYGPETSLTIVWKEAFLLSPPYPNPFNAQSTFTLRLASTQPVSVSVYDVLGRKVSQVYDGVLTEGAAHRLTFEASSLPSGTYFIRATGAGFSATRSVTIAQ